MEFAKIQSKYIFQSYKEYLLSCRKGKLKKFNVYTQKFPFAHYWFDNTENPTLS